MAALLVAVTLVPEIVKAEEVFNLLAASISKMSVIPSRVGSALASKVIVTAENLSRLAVISAKVLSN